MSLRIRLIASIMIVLLVSLCVGGAAAGWHATLSVRAEMQAALGVGTQTARSEIEDLSGARDPNAEISRLVHSFDGDRHVRVVLRDSQGRPRIASTLRPPAPGRAAWFVALLTPPLAPVRLPVGDDSAITIEPDSQNEIDEVWTQLRDDLLAIGLSAGLSIVLVSVVVGRALRPLDRLSAALASLGAGEYAVRVAHTGPPELVRLAQVFNTVAKRLDAERARNHRLNEQLLVLQEEERMDLARDLHDEIGPFLFAVNLDAAAIEHAAASGLIASVPERTRSIREAVGHMQRHVRAMLHRLRPASPVEAGLLPALRNLVSFWRTRLTTIDFQLDVSIDEEALDDRATAAIYRVVQEGLSNAVRHGHPSLIAIVVEAAGSGEMTVRVTDNGTGPGPCNEPGFGFTGMRERVQALGGTLHVGACENGVGFVVEAQMPCLAAMESA